MLTIKAPIETKIRTSYLANQEAFCSRITGSYELMHASLSGEDLLHLAATPPEIYVVEGEGVAGSVSSNVRNETNIRKVEIINNVLNRILMSADAHLTYQDRVFVTDALYKLGVRDDRRFMSAFYRMARETKNTNELIDLYLQNAGHLRELIENIENNEGIRISSQVTTLVEQTDNRLYQSVYDRLMTGAVYQIVSNFNRSTRENTIESNEYMVSEQNYAAQQILLSMLRQSAGMSEGQMFYMDGNIYEEAIENLQVQMQDARNEITAAVLLDLTRNLYHSSYERFYMQKPQFYHFEDAFYRSSTHTLQRLSRFEEGSLFQRVDSRLYQEAVNELSSNELTLLNGIIGQDFYEIIDDVRRLVEREEIGEHFFRTREVTAPPALRESKPPVRREAEPPKAKIEFPEETGAFETGSILQETRETLLRIEREAAILGEQQGKGSKKKNDIARAFQTGETTGAAGTVQGLAGAAEIIFAEIPAPAREEREETEYPAPADQRQRSASEDRSQAPSPRVIREVTEALPASEKGREAAEEGMLPEPLEITHIETVEAAGKEDGSGETGEASTGEGRAARRAPEEETGRRRQVEEVLREYQESLRPPGARQFPEPETPAELTVPGSGEVIRPLGQGEETPEEIERILRAVDAINVSNEERRRQYVEVIRRFEENERGNKGGELRKTRDAAKLALENPEALREQLEREAEENDVKEKALIRELSGVFPKEYRRIYELLNQYMQNAQVLVENHTLVQAEPGELIHDMRMALESASDAETAAKGESRRREPQEVTPERAAQIRELLTQGNLSPEKLIEEGLVGAPELEELIYAEGDHVREEVHQEEGTVTERERRTMQQILETRKETERLREALRTSTRERVSEIREGILTPGQAAEMIHDMRGRLGPYGESGESVYRAGDRASGEQIVREAEAAAQAAEQARRAVSEEPTPVDTVYRRSETLTGEELEETIREMQHNLSRQIQKSTEDVSVQTREESTRTVVHQTGNTQTQVIDQPDISRMIRNGVQSQIGTISDQVFRRLERQMQNEKARRGYH